MALFVLAAGMLALGIGALVVVFPIVLIVSMVRSGRDRRAMRITSEAEEQSFADLVTREWPEGDRPR